MLLFYLLFSNNGMECHLKQECVRPYKSQHCWDDINMKVKPKRCALQAMSSDHNAEITLALQPGFIERLYALEIFDTLGLPQINMWQYTTVVHIFMINVPPLNVL